MKTVTEAEIPLLVKEAVLKIAPDAEVILYGSRARGDYEEDSDWDFLVLCDNGREPEVKKAMSEALYRLGMELIDVFGTYRNLSVVTKAKEYWERPIVKATPFHREITRDGIRL